MKPRLMPLAHDEFVRRRVAAQGPLRGYILAHVQDLDRAEDVLQDVSVVLWKKLETYPPERHPATSTRILTIPASGLMYSPNRAI